MSLTERLRPNVEAAPWVIAEVQQIENRLEQAQEDLDAEKAVHRNTIEQYNRLHAEAGKLKEQLAALPTGIGRSVPGQNNQVRLLRMELQILALELEKIEDSEEAAKAGYAAIPSHIANRLKSAIALLGQQHQNSHHRKKHRYPHTR